MGETFKFCAAARSATASARQGAEHDEMNIPVLGARVIGVELTYELVRTFPAAEFVNEENPSAT